MAEPDVMEIGARAPREVTLRVEEMTSPRFTPRELRLVKEHTGRAFTALVADDESDEKLTVLAWLKLRRDGFLGTLADLDDTVITLETGASEDPTSEPAPTPSPPFAGTGE
jgi:hypothetical protein